MLDKDLFRHRVTELLVGLLDDGDAGREVPRAIAAGRPEPQVWDVDSFSLLQLMLTLEDEFHVSILATVDDFDGDTVDDFADFVAGRAAAAESDLGISALPRASREHGDDDRRAPR